jgi:hypothetical protein
MSVALSFATIAFVAGCTNVGVAASASPGGSVAASVAVVSTANSAAPSSTAAVSEQPTVAATASATPIKTTKPAKSPRASQPNGPAMANLTVTKFVTDLDRLVLAQPAPARVTVKNDGAGDAATFELGITYTDGAGGGYIPPATVDGLAAGESVQLTIDIAPLTAGSLTFTATADAGSAVPESNEDDNSTTLAIVAVDLPNIGFIDPPFSLIQLAGESGYRMDYNYSNLGDVEITTPFINSIEWSSSRASGTFPSGDCCATMNGMHWGPGGSVQSNEGPYSFPEAGKYTVVVTLDAENAVDESNESDNQQSYEITVP